MAISRDWLASLWPASYKGVPFYVDRDREEGGRRIVSHEFPMRDDPFNEDLGEKKRTFSVSAYVASDAADAEAAALSAICATRGAGILVLPAHGQIIARCTEFRRDRDKDRAGLVAFSIEFVREGFAFALATISSLANLIFVNADRVVSAVSDAFVADAAIAGAADFVAAAAVDGIQNAAATLEVVRSSAPVDIAVSAAQRTEIQAVYDAAAALPSAPSSAGPLTVRIAASARALGDAMPAASAVRTFEGVWSDYAAPLMAGTASSTAPAPATVNARQAATNAAAADRTLRHALLTSYCEGIARIELTDRPSAITMRANVAEYFDAELSALPAERSSLFEALTALRNATIEYLSRAILDLAPIVTVQANLSMPSLFWAWRLYADPLRSAELVARNRVVHPSFMPPEFEALAN